MKIGFTKFKCDTDAVIEARRKMNTVTLKILVFLNKLINIKYCEKCNKPYRPENKEKLCYICNLIDFNVTKQDITEIEGMLTRYAKSRIHKQTRS